MAIGVEGLSGMPAVLQPRDVAEAWRWKRTLGASAAFVSGGTLLRTQWENGLAPMPRSLIDLRGLPGFSGIDASDDRISIGALVTLSDCRRSPALALRAPALTEAVRVIGAPSIRNLGTIGGNVVSGIGDVWPALLVHDAELEWFGDRGGINEPAEAWVRRFGTASEPRVLTAIRLPSSSNSGGGPFFEAYRKVCRREGFAPSLVTVALRGRLDEAGRWTTCRIAAGGGTANPKRLAAAEALWNGKTSEELNFQSLYQSVEEEYEAASDPFADAGYRRKTAAGLVAAALWEASGQG
ncbi:molybdopterin dehydrogenase [Paenibacillus antri]|uniref:Molybdopterin dehydrogenase n=1 Tax=Paenibacillus antri TaxID=2582848 RepID=A0A5R9GEF8_9BACL|nr:FAD binding domain-containing protein [Paenibacillus antri]TLS52736.1 molybdopterin dehydrogenase [Paenibacillus antri]